MVRADRAMDRSDLSHGRARHRRFGRCFARPIDFLLTMALAAAMLVLAFDLVERLRRTVRQRLPPPDSAARLDDLRSHAARRRRRWSRCCSSATRCCSATRSPRRRSMRCTFRCTRSSRRASPLPSADPRAGGRLLGRHRRGRADDAAVANAARGRHRARRRSRCRRFPFSSSRFFRARSAQRRRRFRRCRRHSPGLACLSLAWAMAWARPRYRHASQALRLFAGALVLLIPAFVLYPSVHHFADRGLRRLIEEEYARQANDQRPELQQKLQTVLQQIDAARDSESRGAAARRSRTPSNPHSSCGRKRTSPPSGSRLRSSCTVAEGRLDQPVRPEPARLRLDDAALARAELRLGDLRGSVARSDPRSAACFTPAAASATANSDTPTGGSIVVNVMLDYDDAAVHHGAQSVQRADSPGRHAAAGRHGGPLGAVCRVRVGTRIALLVEHARVAARRHAARRHRAVAAAVLDDDERRRATLLDLHPERPRRHLRHRVSCHHAHRSSDQPCRAGDARRPHLCRAADARVVGVGARRHDRRRRAARCCARFAPASTASCFSRSSRPPCCRSWCSRSRPARSSSCSSNRACSPMPSASPPWHNASSRSTWRCRSGTSAPSPSDDIMVWLSRAIDQDVNIYRGPTLRATSERDLFDSGLLPERTPGARVSRDRDRSPVEPRRPGSRSARFRTCSRRRRCGSRKGARFSPCRSRCASRKSIARSTRSTAACCSRPCCSRCSARRSATTWPSASAIPSIG